MPLDIHGKNFIFDRGRGRVVLVDLGNRRVSLNGQRAQREREKDALSLVLRMVGYYGYSNRANDFIFTRLE